MDNLNAHIKTIHEGIRSHTCNECGKYVVSNMDLKRHLTGLKPFHCDQCEKSLNCLFMKPSDRLLVINAKNRLRDHHI